MALLNCCLVVTCLLMTSHLAVTTGGNVEKICNLLCNEESAKESQCAYERGCYEPAVKNDSARIAECLDYCWTSAGQCFALCSSNFNSLLNECFQSGSTTIDSALNCFNEKFLELKKLKLETTIPEDVLNTSEEDFKPYDSTLALSPTIKALLSKESKVDAALAVATGYGEGQKSAEGLVQTTESDHMHDSNTEEYTEDFIAFRELFLKDASQLQKQLDTSLEKEVLKHILLVYQPLQNGYKDEFGIEHLPRSKD